MTMENITLFIGLASIALLIYTLYWMAEMLKHTRDSRLVLSVMLRVLTKHARKNGTDIELDEIEIEVRKVMGLETPTAPTKEK
jgi:hypothetical protein